MGEILEIKTEDVANFVHKGLCGSSFFFGGGITTTTIAPIDFVDFASSGTSGRNFKIAGERKHSEVAGFLIEADDHDGIGELGAIVGAVALVAVHVVATGAKGENIGATISVGFEGLIMIVEEGKEIEDITLATGNFGDNVVAPNNKTGGGGDEEKQDGEDNRKDDFALFGHFFLFLFRLSRLSGFGRSSRMWGW